VKRARGISIKEKNMKISKTEIVEQQHNSLSVGSKSQATHYELPKGYVTGDEFVKRGKKGYFYIIKKMAYYSNPQFTSTTFLKLT